MASATYVGACECVIRARYPLRSRIMRYELPINMPAENTSTPPTTTWNAAARNGVSM